MTLDRTRGSCAAPGRRAAKGTFTNDPFAHPIANDKTIADVNNRMSFYKGKIETLRKTKTGMDLNTAKRFFSAEKPF
jgi:hypothetical protein